MGRNKTCYRCEAPREETMHEERSAKMAQIQKQNVLAYLATLNKKFASSVSAPAVAAEEKKDAGLSPSSKGRSRSRSYSRSRSDSRSYSRSRSRSPKRRKRKKSGSRSNSVNE